MGRANLIRPTRRGPWLAASLCAFSASDRAVAAPPVRFTLDYEAPATCPSEAAFVASVLARAPSAERVSEQASAASAFEVHISEHAGVARGFLLVRVASGPASRRDVPDASCTEIVASMAVIAALVIEAVTSEVAALDGAPDEVSAPAPEAVEPANPPASASVPLPSRPPPRAESSRSPPSPLQPRPRSEPIGGADSAESKTLGWRLGLAVGATLETAVAPTLTPGLAIGADFEPDRPGLLVPSARLSGLYVTSVEPTQDGDARFRWWAARLSGCPVRFAGASAALRPCLELDLGRLEGQGENTQGAREQVLFWAALGPALHFELELARALAVEGQAGVRVLADRGRFVFLPSTEVHDMPQVSFGATLGVVARIP